MNKLVNMHYSLYLLDKMSEDVILERFKDAYEENSVMSVKWLFFAKAAGAKNVFQVCMNHLENSIPDKVKLLLPFIPQFETYDDEAYDEDFDDMDIDEIMKYVDSFLYKHERVNQETAAIVSMLGNTLCIPDSAMDSTERTLVEKILEHNTGYFHNKYLGYSEYDPWEDYPYATFRFDDIKKGILRCSYNRKFGLIRLLLFLLREEYESILKNDDLNTILIFSYEDFDSSIEYWGKGWYEYLVKSYTDKGYRFPKIIFWNTESKNTVIPIQQTETGITMIYGNSSLESLIEIRKCMENPCEFLRVELESPKYDTVKFIFEN